MTSVSIAHDLAANNEIKYVSFHMEKRKKKTKQRMSGRYPMQEKGEEGGGREKGAARIVFTDRRW